MSRIDTETKRKLREMGVAALVDAFDIQDDTLTLGMVFEERVKLAVDDAHATFTHAKVEGLIRRAGLRYPNADLRRVDLLEQRGLDRGVIAQLGTCQFISRQMNVVFQGFTGSGKSYLGSALAKQACQHRYRAHYIRMPDLEETWAAAKDKPAGREKWLRKYSTFTLLVIDECRSAGETREAGGASTSRSEDQPDQRTRRKPPQPALAPTVPSPAYDSRMVCTPRGCVPTSIVTRPSTSVPVCSSPAIVTRTSPVGVTAAPGARTCTATTKEVLRVPMSRSGAPSTTDATGTTMPALRAEALADPAAPVFIAVTSIDSVAPRSAGLTR